MLLSMKVELEHFLELIAFDNVRDLHIYQSQVSVPASPKPKIGQLIIMQKKCLLFT